MADNETTPIITYRPESQHLTRPVRVLVVQNGPATLDKRQNVDAMVEWMRKGLEGFAADFVVFCELATTIYFAGTNDPKWQDEAETIPGPTTELFSRLAAEYKVNVVLPIYERGPKSGQFFNSAVFLDRRGEIIPGLLPDGTQVSCYRKTHIPDSYSSRPAANEKFFFRPGPGLPIFRTDVATVGCLICYDRSFPEAWKVQSLSGAEIMFVPNASAPKRRAGTFIPELQAAAIQNGVFVVAVNKGGLEVLEDERVFFGNSCLIDPESNVLAQCPSHQGPVLMQVEFDLADKLEYNRKYHYLRDRRPELYGILSQVSFV
ncbi:MAG: carbon-nitrogen hydrolase family protein [Chloroflexota bacterium]